MIKRGDSRTWVEGDEEGTLSELTYDYVDDCRVDSCEYLANQVARVTYPVYGARGVTQGVDEVSYNALGQLTHQRRSFDGQTFNYRMAYNVAGMLTEKTFPDGTKVNYRFDGAGRLASVPGYIEDVTYNAKGAVRQVKYADGSHREVG